MFVLDRAMMLIDQQNVIRYLQVTRDLGQLPDSDSTIEQAQRLVRLAP